MTTATDEYAQAYSRITNVTPAYEGASLNYKRELHNIFNGEADTLAASELSLLQARSAHAIRNNGYAKTALKKWVTNLNSIKVVWKDKNGKKHKIMQTYWDEFCKNPSYDGFGDMNVLQSISNASIFTYGNSYIRKLVVRTNNSNVVPLKLQLIPAPLHNMSFGNVTVSKPDEVVRYGMKFKNSLPVSYFFGKSVLETPYGAGSYLPAAEVPAEEIIHTFIREEPGQWIGIPLLSSILLSLYELDELLEATIAKQKAAQAISMIVEAANNTANMLPVGSPVYSTEADGTEKLVFKAKGGNVQYTNKGESVKWFQGGDIGANFSVLVESELRRIAATLDLAYHELTGDTSGLNYSSLIGLSILSRNRLEYLHNFLLIPLREKPIAESFKELAVVYNKKCATAIPSFQLPKWRGTDDLKDAQSDILELQNGLGTYTDKLAERGLSLEDVLADRETLLELEKYGIVLTSAASTPSMNQANNTQANSNSTGT
jgi:lambda family phage portal protein